MKNRFRFEYAQLLAIKKTADEMMCSSYSTTSGEFTKWGAIECIATLLLNIIEAGGFDTFLANWIASTIDTLTDDGAIF